jgi:hypothetical protein
MEKAIHQTPPILLRQDRGVACRDELPLAPQPRCAVVLLRVFQPVQQRLQRHRSWELRRFAAGSCDDFK